MNVLACVMCNQRPQIDQPGYSSKLCLECSPKCSCTDCADTGVHISNTNLRCSCPAGRAKKAEEEGHRGEGVRESYRFSVECGICHRYSTFDHDPITWKCQQGNCRAEHDVHEGVTSVRRQSYEPVPTIPKDRYRMRCPECGTYVEAYEYVPNCSNCGGNLPAPGAGRKLDQNKPRYDLLPHLAMKATARILAFGAVKYAEDNWRIVPQRKKRYYRAAIGHLMEWWMSGGKARDPETGESHLAHALCCVMFLLDEEEAERLTSASEPR